VNRSRPTIQRSVRGKVRTNQLKRADRRVLTPPFAIVATPLLTSLAF